MRSLHYKCFIAAWLLGSTQVIATTGTCERQWQALIQGISESSELRLETRRNDRLLSLVWVSSPTYDAQTSTYNVVLDSRHPRSERLLTRYTSSIAAPRFLSVCRNILTQGFDLVALDFSKFLEDPQINLIGMRRTSTALPVASYQVTTQFEDHPKRERLTASLHAVQKDNHEYVSPHVLASELISSLTTERLSVASKRITAEPSPQSKTEQQQKTRQACEFTWQGFEVQAHQLTRVHIQKRRFKVITTMMADHFTKVIAARDSAIAWRIAQTQQQAGRMAVIKRSKFLATCMLYFANGYDAMAIDLQNGSLIPLTISARTHEHVSAQFAVIDQQSGEETELIFALATATNPIAGVGLPALIPIAQHVQRKATVGHDPFAMTRYQFSRMVGIDAKAQQKIRSYALQTLEAPKPATNKQAVISI